jgi:hypothetical protein
MPFKKGISGNKFGRNKGVPNKITSDVRESIQSFIELNFADVQKIFESLEPKDQLKFMVDLLPFVIPKKQNNQIDVSLSEQKEGTIIKWGNREISI